MSKGKTVIKVGQVWRSSYTPELRYIITDITPYYPGSEKSLVSARLEEDRHNTSYHFCIVDSNDHVPAYEWNDDGHWRLVSVKVFSRINQRTLRKRMRDQISGIILIGKS